MRLLDKLKALLGGGYPPLQTIEPSSMKLEDVSKMLHLLDTLPGVEVVCDDVLEVLDELAEAAVRGDNVADLMPIIHMHVMKCPNCFPKYQMLLRILQAVPA